MNNDLSNKTLVVVLMATLFVSMFGLLYSLQKVDTLNSKISGFAIQDTGTAHINISSETSIILTNDIIDFGTGYINTTINECSLGNNATLMTGNSSTPNGLAASALNEYNCWTGVVSEDDDFIVQSLANVPILIDVQALGNASDFIGSAGQKVVPEFQYQTYNAGGNGCANSQYITTWTEFDKTNQDICGASGNVGNKDDMVGMTVRIVLPAGVTGDKTVSVQFTAAEA